MAQSSNEAIAKIQEYATEARQSRENEMDIDASPTDIETRLDETLKELQTRVEEQQAALEELRAKAKGPAPTAPSEDRRERLKQFHILRDAYKTIAQTPPDLPPKTSVLPSLLAARHLQGTISGSKSAISSTSSQLRATETALRREQAALHDANLITAALERRIARLRAEAEAKTQQTPTQVAHDMIKAQQGKKAFYDSRMHSLSAAFEKFIDDHLASMLAAEELGGPVVGNMLSVSEDALAAGFTQQGRAKATRKPVSDSRRQKRIDEIWGDRAVLEEDDGEERLSEMEAAGRELRELIEELFTALVAGGGGTYVDLERESAASRFLVRSKIAQFHPRDARKIRLIDFGRELDD